MQKDDTKIHVDAHMLDDIRELVIRHGDAPRVIEEVALDVKGRIDAPRTFFSSRKHLADGKYFDPTDTIVFVNRAQQKIRLIHGENNPLGTKIEGTLTLSREYNALQINEVGSGHKHSDACFTTTQLADLLKRHRHLFADKQTAMKIVSDLKDFKGTVKTELEKKSDSRGTNHNLVSTSVESNIPLDFVLNLPLFEGQKPVAVRVEIGISGQGSAVQCWLESIEALELIESERDKIIDEEIKAFEGFTVIEQ